VTVTSTEWEELVRWVSARFPNDPWHAENAVAYFYDIQQYDVSDVWAGLMRLYEKGQRFAPNGSQLIAATIDEQHKTARDAAYDSLPADASAPISWETYVTMRFGELLTPAEVIDRIHQSLPVCGNVTCGLHYPKEEQ